MSHFPLLNTLKKLKHEKKQVTKTHPLINSEKAGVNTTYAQLINVAVLVTTNSFLDKQN